MKKVDVAVAFNRKRWDELSASNVRFSVPCLDLDRRSAREMVDPEGKLGPLAHAKVLCLAASGGQQSAAFGILGARVTVFDLSDNQLAKDRQTADRYGIRLRTVQGDMQDLSAFRGRSFDVVWLAHSINFVPSATATISEIARVCKVGGKVRMHFTNPYVHGVWDRPCNEGFLLTQPYVDGQQIKYRSPYWTFADSDGRERKVRGPREYRHSLSTIVNSLIACGFTIDGLWEDLATGPSPKVGTWYHFRTLAPPWLTIWARRQKIRARPRQDGSRGRSGSG